MPTKKLNHTTLLRYWTLRYVVTLFLGLLLIGITSVMWIQYSFMHKRLQSLQEFSKEAAKYVVNKEGKIVIPDQFYEWIDTTQRVYKLPGRFGLTVFDHQGNSLFYKARVNGDRPPESGLEPKPDPKSNPSPPDTNKGNPATSSDPLFPSAPPLNEKIIITKIGDQYTVSTPISHGNSVIGTVAVSYSKKILTDSGQDYKLIAALLLLSGLLGWIIIYLLLRQLTKPISGVVEALKKVEAGDYRMALQANVKEKEIYDLLVSFKSMANRLEHLEELRTELLAGVTHDLKTPVTSIHGLIRAVRDQVVASTEAEEFLDISLKETIRLQQMISDLLDFNAFASGKINLQLESMDLGKLLGEIIYQWSLIYQDDRLEIVIDIPDRPFLITGDASRIQQIMVNLLNNSKQALRDHGKISVSLLEHSSVDFEIQVRDNGSGIQKDEQINIFERYFRGKNKKIAVGGLGLGLTFSRMLATAMNGKLMLIESSSQGTAFQLVLPIHSNTNTIY